LVEPYVVLQNAVLALLEIKVCDEVRRPVVAARAEPMQVAVVPAHRGLDHVVQPGQGQVARQFEAPPHRRLRPVQVETHSDPSDG
jgi:hypothetical protein